MLKICVFYCLYGVPQLKQLNDKMHSELSLKVFVLALSQPMEGSHLHLLSLSARSWVEQFWKWLFRGFLLGSV